MSGIWRRYRTLSVFWAMALPATVLLSMLGGGVALAAYVGATTALHTDLHGRAMTRSVSSAAEFDYLLGSSDPGAGTRILALLDEPVQSPERLYAFVEDASGGTTHQSGLLTAGLLASLEAAEQSDGPLGVLGDVVDDGSPRVIEFATTDYGEVMDTAIRLSDGSVFHTGHQSEEVHQLANQVVTPLLLAVGLAVIGAVTLIGLLSRQVTAPLRSLVILVRRIEGGDYQTSEQPPAFREISELSRAMGVMAIGLAERAQLRDDNERLEAVDRLKTEFVALASHELRTPLTGIYGYSQLLTEADGLSDAERQWADHIQREAGRLTDIVEQLLNVSVIESGELKVAHGVVDLGEVIATVVGALAPGAGEHGIQVDCAEEVAARGDRGKLIEVLRNLVENAVKYSPATGRVWVSCEEMGDVLRVSVRDEGLGIPDAERSKLFTRFHRIHRPGYETIRSTGLGLYLVKQLVEVMGGEVGVESVEGEGSTVWFTVPRSQADLEAAA